jgi:NAD(P) transhydrogenase subunit beta
VVTLFNSEIESYGGILAGLALGGLVGILLTRGIEMTAMPQLVAILHSFVGLAAVLVALGVVYNAQAQTLMPISERIELGLGCIIGAITFLGSVVAFLKLQEWLKGKALHFAHQGLFSLSLLMVVLLTFLSFLVFHEPFWMVILALVSAVLGMFLVLAIGGADMPVVVSLLNSYSGWAAAATGFSLNHHILMMSGALIGSSGAILSYVMCKSMNRSLLGILFGKTQITVARQQARQSIRQAAPDDCAFALENASQVVIVPGYGLAVAQAQHVVKELFLALQRCQVEVVFAIHPIAGRMPGHMNVLLAEADIAYEAVVEMEQINADFAQTDVVLVIGANDVVNPAALSDQSSPLFGMPILEVHKARQVFVLKRSMQAGYAGVENALFSLPNCALVFGDAKKTCEALLLALKK